jgi:hypothetical protein
MTPQDPDNDKQAPYELPAFMLAGYKSLRDIRRQPMPDGTIHVGISPTKHVPVFTAATNLSYYADSFLFTLIKADHVMKLVKNCDHDGHRDWRLPDLAEMRVLLENREAIYFETGWYWVSGADAMQPEGAMHFPDGTYERDIAKVKEAFVRCIRYGAEEMG